MESIRADVHGLTALSGVCQREAEGLNVLGGRRHEGPNFQSTAAAIDQVASIVGRTESLISVRLRVTGHKFAIAAERFAECEATSRQQIAAVGDELRAT
jgi:hypothetical protein